MAPISPDALERWMYRKDGMDYGPFSTHDIMEMLVRNAIEAATEVRTVRSRDWRRVEQVPRLADALAELLRKRAEERRHQEDERGVAKVERRLVMHRRIPVMGLGLLVLAGGVTAFFILRPETPVIAGYSHFFKDLKFGALPAYVPPAAPAPAPAADAQGSASRTVRHHARGSSPGASAGAATSAVPAGPGSVADPIEVDLSDDGSDASGGRELGSEDLEAVQRKATPALVRCFRLEAEREPSFQGGSVTLYVMNKGPVRLSRVSTNPAPSAELHSCARAAVAGLAVPPFKGASQVMEIPLHVATMR